LPRAVCVDHELYRVLAANGMSSQLPDISHVGPRYQWFNAQWKELLVIDWSAASVSGGSEVNFVHQPTLEEALDAAVASHSSIETFLGWEAISAEQDAEFSYVTLRHSETGETQRLTARYVVGCDGANSMVRNAIGSEREDRGFEADWLVIDVKMKEGVTIEKLGIPAAGQYCNPVRPTTIVPAGVRNGTIYRRWEFMRLPGEANEELEKESRVWELLSPWATPDDVELVRHKVYNFRSLLADRWRDRRLLIAGDAAHVMPPFMGQGMCSGFRDAWNLAWKLSLILDGKADERLLDTYQLERMPHVSQLIDVSIYLGKIICIPDPEAAAERDRAFLSGTASPPPPFPQLTVGLLHRDSGGALSAGAGLLAPHVTARRGGTTGRFDDVVGLGFVVISRTADPVEILDESAKSALALLPTRYATLGDSASASFIEDLDGRLAPFMIAQGWDVMIVRPDFYVYGGTVNGVGLPALVLDLVRDLSEAGVRFARATASKSLVGETHEARTISV